MLADFLLPFSIPLGLGPWMRLLLCVGASTGHASLLIFFLNWLYGHALPRDCLRCVRRTIYGLILTSPVAFWFVYEAASSARAARTETSPLRTVLVGYGNFCCIIGLGLMPAITLRRLLRRPPAALVSNHTNTIDVAGALKYPPAGRGKHAYLARLPFNEVFQVDFAERSLCLERLPAAWDGLSVLHLSDLHLFGVPDRQFFEYVLDRCREWEPDIVALTGDIVDSRRHHRWIIPLLGRLHWRHAAFAILGNHDYYYDPPLVRRRLHRLGIRVLGNSWEQIEIAGERMTAIGNEEPWFYPRPDLSRCPAGGFRLCLSHTPDNIRWARRHGVDLMLAGHNHGGQIRFPVLGSVIVPSLYGRRYDCGTFYEAPTLLHVSRGLSGQYPLRWNCKPEVTKLVLRARGNVARAE